MKRAFLILACLFPFSAFGQSNIAAGYALQTSTSNGNNNTVVLISFTTGANSAGYNVTNAKVFVATAAGANSLQAAIYADSNGPAGTGVCSSPGISTTNGWNTLTPSGCGTLTANTKYWLAQNTNSATQSNGFTGSQCPNGDNWYFATNTYGTWGALSGLTSSASDCFSQYVILTPVTSTAPSMSLAENGQSGAGTTFSPASVSITSGETIITTVFYEIGSTVTIADSATNSYSTLASNPFDSGGRLIKEFCAVHSGADTNLTQTITIGTSGQIYVTVRKYAQLTCNIDGIVQTGDVTSATPAVTTPTGTFTTTVQPDLALCDSGFVSTPSSVAAGSGYAIRQTFGTGGSVFLASADQGGAGAGINIGSYGCGFTLGSSVEAGLVGLALKGSNAATPVAVGSRVGGPSKFGGGTKVDE